MQTRIATVVLSTALLAVPLFAGALVLQVTDPHTNPEAQAKHAVMLIQVTACNSPERTELSVTAEGLAGGQRKTVPLHAIKLSTPGLFAVAREWPDEGVWAVRVTATNPEYKNYTTGVLAPVTKETWSKAGTKQFYRAPTEDDVNSALSGLR